MSNVIPCSASARFVIGIAGYMGSGKTTCCRAFAGFDGVLVVDGDREARNLMIDDLRIHRQLERSFGPEIFENGAISFKKLGTVVFSDLRQLRKLNAIVHPLLLQRLRKTIFERENGIVVLDAAVLPLWNIGDWLNVRIWIDAPFEKRLSRLLLKGTGLSDEEVRLRMRQQETLFQPPSAPEWFHMVNDGEPEALQEALMSHMARYGVSRRPTGDST